MFNIRKRDVARPQGREMVEINAEGVDVPLKRDWLQRWCILPTDVQEMFEKIYNFEVFDDDVFVVTYPKCGTTWMQEAAWLLLYDLNYDVAKEVDLMHRSVFMDLRAIYSDLPADTIKAAANSARPRLIKTHLPAHLMPRQAWKKNVKIIYCARNPKDVAVSYYHFHKDLGTWSGSIDEFVDDFIKNDIMYSPYWPHILDFWHMRNQKNVFFTTFEEMKRNLKGVLIKLNRFLGKADLSEENLECLVQHLDFNNMKANKKTNPTEHIINGYDRVSKDFQFMRRGIIGAYHDELSQENQQKINEWSKKILEQERLNESEMFGSKL